MDHFLIPPHGNHLVHRVLTPEHSERMRKQQMSKNVHSVRLDSEQVKTVKNIARGVYSPLEGFMNEDDFMRVVEHMRLCDGTIWPLPIVLDIPPDIAHDVKKGDSMNCCDDNGALIAVLHVEDVYIFDAMEVVQHLFGTTSVEHPGVAHWMRMHRTLVGGSIDLIDNTKEPYYEFNLDPMETRLLFHEMGWNTVVGFQTRNAPHRAHEYLQRCALEIVDGLLIHPIIGRKKAGDFTDEAIIRSYDYLIKNFFPRDRVVFSILPAQMYYAGPREAILHAIIRKNFGCTHFVVGRDHAGVKDFYHSTAAQEIFSTIEDIGIQILKFDHGFHCKKCEGMATTKTCGHDNRDRTPPSGTLIRTLISTGKPVSAEMMRPEIVTLLLQFDQPFVAE